MCTFSVLTNLTLLSAQMPIFLVVFIPVFGFYCAFEVCALISLNLS